MTGSKGCQNRRAKIQGRPAGAHLDLSGLLRSANDALGAAGYSIPQIADEAGIEAARLYAYQTGDSPTFLRVCRLIVAQASMGEPGVLDRLADMSSFLLVPVPAPASPATVRTGALEAVAAAMTEASGVVETFTRVIEDGVVTPAEAALLADTIRHAESALERLRALAEEVRA